MSGDIFISYANNDVKIANAVCHGLEYSGIKCWIAPRDILAGQRWAGSIHQAIANSKIMIVVFSSSANSSTYVLNEITDALDVGVKIVLYRVQDVPLSGEMKIHVGGVQWFDAVNSPLDDRLPVLVRIIRQILAGNNVVLKTTSKFRENYDTDHVTNKEKDLTIQTNTPVRAIRFVSWIPVMLPIVYFSCSAGVPNLIAKYNLDSQYILAYTIAISVAVSIIYIYTSVGIMLGRRNELSVRKDCIVLRRGYGFFDIKYVEIAEWPRGMLTHLGVKKDLLSLLFNSATVLLHSSDRDTIELPDMKDYFIFRSSANSYLKINSGRPEIISSAYFMKPILCIIEIMFFIIALVLLIVLVITLWEMFSKGILGNNVSKTYGELALELFIVLFVSAIFTRILNKIQEYRKRISY